MPRLSEDIPIIVVQTKGSSTGSRDLKVRRAHVLTWLRWLKENSVVPGYKNMQIDMGRVENLPEDGYVDGIRVIETDETFEHLGNTRDDNMETIPDDDDINPLSDTGVPLPHENRQSEEEIIYTELADALNDTSI